MRVFDASVTRFIEEEDALIVGKTNLDEFAMGSANITSAFGNVKNPWKGKDGKELVPGGSSGGSAAAVAADLCPITLGSDTGGSIRQPAALCGVSGIKPTYGRVSRSGVIAFASSLDQVGPFADDALDCAAIAEVIAGHDARDARGLNVIVRLYAGRERKSAEPWATPEKYASIAPRSSGSFRMTLRPSSASDTLLVPLVPLARSSRRADSAARCS